MISFVGRFVFLLCSYCIIKLLLDHFFQFLLCIAYLKFLIFNAMQTKYNVKMSKLSIENQELEISNAKKELKKVIQQEFYNAIAAEQKYKAADETYHAAQLAYQFSSESYDAGKSTLLELNESKNRLFKSESEMLQAKYEYLYRLQVLEFYNQ